MRGHDGRTSPATWPFGLVTGAVRLTNEQERDLVIATEAGDLDACHRLVEAFLPPIAALARRFPDGIGVERQELIQEGVAGLLFATRRYDPDLGTPFWAYATYWVRKAMQDLVAELTMPLALSDRAVRGLATIRAARRDHLSRYGTEPTTNQLVSATGLGRDHIARLLAAARVPASFEAPFGGDRDDAVADHVRDGDAEQAFDQVLDAIEFREVQDLTDGLAERERAVLRAHYGLGTPAQTLQQIGQGLGLTAERARQIESAALGKLRSALSRVAPKTGSV
jgi:RNA polymerase primary sigma factor